MSLWIFGSTNCVYALLPWKVPLMRRNLRTVKSSLWTVYHFCDPYGLYGSTNRIYMTSLAMKINTLSPTNEMQFTDVKSSLRTVYHFCDPYGPYGSTNRIWPLMSPTYEMQFTKRQERMWSTCGPYITFAIRTVCTDGQTIYGLSCHENILSPTKRCSWRTAKSSLRTEYYFCDPYGLYGSTNRIWPLLLWKYSKSR